MPGLKPAELCTDICMWLVSRRLLQTSQLLVIYTTPPSFVAALLLKPILMLKPVYPLASQARTYQHAWIACLSHHLPAECNQVDEKHSQLQRHKAVVDQARQGPHLQQMGEVIEERNPGLILTVSKMQITKALAVQ